MSQIELYSKLQNNDPFKAVSQMGATLAKSGMFGCERAEQGEVLAMICLTENMTPSQVVNKFHIIGGRLSRKSGSALAEFKRMGGKYKWARTGQEPDQNLENREAVGEFSLDDQTVTVRFSIDEAKQAGLVKPGSTWSTMPWKMLRARVVSDALGMIAPEIYYGDDMEEIPSEPKTINLASDEPKQEPEPKLPKEIPIKESRPTVFEAEIVNEPEADDAKPEIESNQNKPAEEKPQQSSPELPDETVKALQKAIGAEAKSAMAYFIQKGWLKKGQNLEHLTPAQATRILKNTAAFLAKAREVHA